MRTSMMLVKPAVALVAWTMLAGAALGAVKTREIDYQAGATPLKGFLAYDDAVKGKRPGVIVLHEWWGLNEYAREQAQRLASAGYVAFAADLYGNGKVTRHPQDAKAFAQEASKDPEAMKARFDAATAALKDQPQVDPSRIAAIGYCFGGGVALRMARAGEPLAAVATFHAAIPPPAPVEKGTVKTPILIQTGGADPMVPVEKVQELASALRHAGDEVEVVVYPGAKHAFTVPDAGTHGMEGLRYDPAAAKKSWSRMLEFFDEHLKKT